MSTPPLTPMRFWGLTSAVLIAVGSFGPWETIGIISRGALDGDALITLGAGIIAFGLVFFDRMPILVLLIGIAVVAIAEIDGEDITQHEVFGQAFQRGWGLLMVEVAGVSIGLWGLVQQANGSPVPSRPAP